MIAFVVACVALAGSLYGLVVTARMRRGEREWKHQAEALAVENARLRDALEIAESDVVDLKDRLAAAQSWEP